ncbi:MAG: glycosyltransferase [Clostridia bacterium]|nr:glycosyltransferase [Clostridia bacterium]
MNIIIDVQTLYTDEKARGIGIFTANWLNGIRDNNDYNIHFMRINNNKWEFIANDSAESLQNILYGSLGKWKIVDTITQFCFDNDIDLMIFTSPLMPNIQLPLEELPCKKGYIVYDLIPLVLPDKYVNNWPIQIKEDYYTKLNIINKGDLILTISNATKNDLMNHLSIPSEKIFVIYLSIKDFFRPIDKKKAKGELEKSRGLTSPFIFSITGYDPRKNNKGLIKALSLLSKEFQDLKLVILGIKKPNDEEFMQYARSLNVNDKIVFLDYVSDEMLVTIYNACDIFVFPSEYEGFGIPILEAFKTGAPVITSNVSSMPEIAADGAALLVDPSKTEQIAEAIQKILTDDSLRNSLIERGFKRSNNFSWRNVKKETLIAFDFIKNKNCLLEICEKPKLAFFSPLNPQQSGISDYSEELLPYLSKYFEIHLFVSGFVPSNTFIKNNYPIHDFSDKTTLKILDDFPLRLYQIGNNELHYPIYEALKQYPGIIVLHDYNLFGFFLHLTHLRNKSSEFIEEMEYAHDKEGRIAAEKIIHEGIFPDVMSFPINKRMVDCSKGVIVHSEWSKKELLKNINCKMPIIKIPQAVPLQKLPTISDKKRIKSSLNLSEVDFIIGVFGNVTWNKRLHAIINSFCRLLQTHPNSKLIIIGNCSKDMHTELNILIKQNKVDNNVRVTGGIDFDTFNDYIKISDICINLRWPTMGETSATLLRAISFGIPSIVSNVGSYKEYPDDFCWKVDPDEYEEDILLAYLFHMASNQALREVMGQYAHSYAKRELSLAEAAEKYARALYYSYKNFAR